MTDEGPPFSQRVEVLYPDPMRDDDVVLVLCPYLRNTGKFLHDGEKLPIMHRLLKGSSVRFGKRHAVLMTPIWLWNTYLRAVAEIATGTAVRAGNPGRTTT